MSNDDDNDLEESWEALRPLRGILNDEDAKKAAEEAAGGACPEFILHPDRLPNETVTPAGVIHSGESHEVGRMPVRSEVTVLAADDTEQRRIGFMFHEITDEEAAERDSPENLQRLKETRERPADGYNTSQGFVHVPSGHRGHTVIPVLQDLWGTPWNQAAANFLQCLRPSLVRAVGHRQAVTLDACTWRVTVYLDELQNIERIEQEVEVELEGFRNGHDASCYMQGYHNDLEQPIPRAYINPRGIARMNIPRE